MAPAQQQPQRQQQQQPQQLQQTGSWPAPAPMVSAGGTGIPGPPLSRARPQFPSQHPPGASPAPPIAPGMLSPPPLQKPALTLPPGISVGISGQGTPQAHLHLPGARPGGLMSMPGPPQLGLGIVSAPSFAGLDSVGGQGPGALSQRPLGPGGMDPLAAAPGTMERVPLLVPGVSGHGGAMGLAPGVAPALMGARGRLTLPLGMQEVKGLSAGQDGGVTAAKWQETMQLRMKSLWTITQTACREMAAAHSHRLEQLRASDEAEEEAVQEALQRYLRTAEVLSAVFSSDASSLTLLPGEAPESTPAPERLTETREQTDGGPKGEGVEQTFGTSAKRGAEQVKAAESGRKKGARKPGTRRSQAAEASEAAASPPEEHKDGVESVEVPGSRKQKRTKVTEDADPTQRNPTQRTRNDAPSAEDKGSKQPQGATEFQEPSGLAGSTEGVVAGESSKGPGMEVEGGLEDVLQAAAYAMLRCGWNAGSLGWGLQSQRVGGASPEGEGPGEQGEHRHTGAAAATATAVTVHAASPAAGAGTEASLKVEVMGPGGGKGVAEEASWTSRVLARVEELADRLSRNDTTFPPGAPERVPWGREHQGSKGRGASGDLLVGPTGATKPRMPPRDTWASGAGLSRSHAQGTYGGRPGCVSRWSRNRPLLAASSLPGAVEGKPWHLREEGEAGHGISREATVAGREGEEQKACRRGVELRGPVEEDESSSPLKAAVLQLLTRKESWADVLRRQMDIDAEIAQHINAKNF